MTTLYGHSSASDWVFSPSTCYCSRGTTTTGVESSSTSSSPPIWLESWAASCRPAERKALRGGVAKGSPPSRAPCLLGEEAAAATEEHERDVVGEAVGECVALHLGS